MKVTIRNTQVRDNQGRMVGAMFLGNGSVEDAVDSYLTENPDVIADGAAQGVTDWLEENITQPTNPVIDASLSVSGAAADAKATGDEISDLKSAVNLTFMKNDLGFPVTSDMLELGRIDDSGNPATHSSRCRTKYFLPVNKGDTVVIGYLASNSVMISYYDESKTFLSNSSWLMFIANIDNQVVAADGYIKLTFNSADISMYDGVIKVSRTSKHITDVLALESKLESPILPIPSASLEVGCYWGTAASKLRQSSPTRATVANPIKVKKGDELHFTAKNDLYIDVGFGTTGNSASFRGYVNMPYKAPSDGYLYVNAKKSDNSVISDLSEWDKKITIKKADEIGLVETVSESDLYNGYINSSNVIADHSTRLVNWNPIHANKGDIVRINNMNLMFQPYEYNSAKTLLTNAPTYITPTYVGGSYPVCGDYVVQNDDCWVMVVIAPTYGFTPSSFLPSDYPNAFSVIHIEENRNINTAEDTYFRFPKSARKPIPFETSAVVSQAATIVKGKMWAAVDDTTDYFQVVNLETGEVERTISHNLGHCNSLDYCEKTDTLLTVDSTTNYQTILLYPNASNAQSSIAKADCISIPVSSDVISQIASCCFGQDHREILIYCGYGSTTPYNLYKMVLGYANGAYDGTVTLKKTYTGVIRDNIDTYVTQGTTGYAQDSCYDGYYYLAYGTSGHNFLIIDLDDIHNTYRVVGNYLHHEYKDDYTEYGVEPEGVFLDGSKIYCLSRQNTAQLSFFNVFTR